MVCMDLERWIDSATLVVHTCDNGHLCRRTFRKIFVGVVRLF